MVNPASRSISCQKCGGVVECVAGQQYLKCSFCESLILNGEATASVDHITPMGSVLESQCPICHAALQTGQMDGRPALYCNSCFGILLKHEDFGAILRERCARRAALEPAEPRPIDPAAFARQLNCPACQNRMEAHPYYGPGNVVIDSCAECGFVWLDQGEISRVEQASGGSSGVSDLQIAGNNDPRSVGVAFVPDPTADSPLRMLADLLF